MDIPKQIPDNIGKFVNEQVKHFAALLGRKINTDFCGVSGISPDGSHASCVLAAASDKKRVANLVEMYRQIGIHAEAIEPTVLAYIRALHKEKIEGRFESNVMITIVRDNKLTLCVFRKQSLDFIRTRDIGESAGTEQISKWLTGQINTVIQSYQVKALHNSGQWETTIVADCDELPTDSEEALRANIQGSEVQLLTSENACKISSISRIHSKADSVKTNEPSLAAIGLAMKLLDTNVSALGVNLLPEETVRMRATRKMALVTANVIAVILLTAILAVAGSIWKVQKISKDVDKKKASLLQETRSLFEENQALDEQINNISNKLKVVNKISDSQSEIYWPDLLSYIAKVRPKMICITSMASGKGSQVTLKGLALSNEDVYLFTETLKKSELIDSASIYETNKNDKDNRFINYEIRCIAAPRKGT
jgi:Tfp pilus assembly protein PilN